MSGLGVTSPLQSRTFFRETKGVETSPYYWHSLAQFAGCTILLCSAFQDSHTCALSLLLCQSTRANVAWLLIICRTFRGHQQCRASTLPYHALSDI